jgi:hypothetical protein
MKNERIKRTRPMRARLADASCFCLVKRGIEEQKAHYIRLAYPHCKIKRESSQSPHVKGTINERDEANVDEIEVDTSSFYR